MSYDSPNGLITREPFTADAGGGATTTYAKFRQFQAFKLKAVHATVTTAGTATTHGYDIYSGTTSIATIAISTESAGVLFSNTAVDQSYASNVLLSVRSLADATGLADISYEIVMDWDATQSA